MCGPLEHKFFMPLSVQLLIFVDSANKIGCSNLPGLTIIDINALIRKRTIHNVYQYFWSTPDDHAHGGLLNAPLRVV